LGTKFLSHLMPARTQDAGGQDPTSGITLEGLDHQQRLVLGALRRAAGNPVSYAELRSAGVELPASVVSELELAGVAVERCSSEEPGAVGVRLDPANDPAVRSTPETAERPMPTDAEPEPAWSSVRIDRARSVEGLVPSVPGRLSRPTSVVAVAALLAGVAVVCAVVAISVPGGGPSRRVPIAKRPHARVLVASGGARPAGAARTRPSPHPVPVSPALATELEAQGHSLLEAGQYGDAVPVLKRAVLATGESLGACLEPASSTCLTYAYALYDLGRAVRLSGQPQAAVPILERRLQIDNQRSTVGAQLQLARQGIG